MGKIVKTISADGAVICFCADTTDIAAEAERLHTTSAVVTAAMGRLMTAASIMGSMLKGEQSSLTLRVAGGGPIGSLIAVSDSQGNVRAYATNPVVELPLNSRGKLDVGGAVGKDGFLNVIKDFGFGEPYAGHIPLVTGEIAEDITSYYATSEQIPTVCGLGVLVNPDLTVRSAGGYLIQLLPGADDSTIDRLEQNINALPPVSSMFDTGMTPADIAFKALEGFEPQILDEYEVEYRCNCTRERVEQAFLSMGTAELLDMADQQEPTEALCHFCNKKYYFTSEELKKLAKEGKRVDKNEEIE